MRRQRQSQENKKTGEDKDKKIKTRQDKTRKDKARQDKTKQDKDKTGQHYTTLHKTRQKKTKEDNKTTQDSTRQDTIRLHKIRQRQQDKDLAVGRLCRRLLIRWLLLLLSIRWLLLDVVRIMVGVSVLGLGFGLALTFETRNGEEVNSNLTIKGRGIILHVYLYSLSRLGLAWFVLSCLGLSFYS
jgi:hypothetical protein